MKEGQTSTEYIIMAAVVIVIGIVITIILGDSSDTLDNPVIPSNDAKLRTEEIGLADFAITDVGTKLVVINNKPFEVSVNAIYINDSLCDSPAFFLDIGQQKNIECYNIGSIEYGKNFNLNFYVNYSNMNGIQYFTRESRLIGEFARGSEGFYSRYEGICSNESSSFFAGDGSVVNPYEICNCQMLQNINKNPALNYELVTDLDCYDETRTGNLNDSGKGFTPIDSFSGIFDGNDFSIRGLYFFRDDKNYVALFSDITSSGIVKDLTTYFFNVTSIRNGSGIVGKNLGLIDNCQSFGNINGHGYIGGIVSNNLGVVQFSRSNINLFSSGSLNYVGGIAGINSGKITDSQSNGNLSGAGSEKYIGGIAGQNNGIIEESKSLSILGGDGNDNFLGGITAINNGTISNSYNVEAITATGSNKIIGGISGRNTGQIYHSYSLGNITAQGSPKNNSVGGIIGINIGGTITASYFDLDAVTCNSACMDSEHGVPHDYLINSSWLQANGWSYPPWVSSSSYPVLNWE